MIKNPFKREANGFAADAEPRRGKLNLPGAIADELARLATLELKSQTDSQLNPAYQAFLADVGAAVSEGLKSGMVAFKPYLSGNKLHINIAKKNDFRVLEWDEQARIPLVTEFYERKDDLVRVERHVWTNGVYSVSNIAMQNGKMLETLPDCWGSYAPYTEMAGIDRPLFSIFSTPDGRPVYEKVLPLIQEAERQFDRLIWEFESGKRALYVADTAFLKDWRGNPKLPDKRLYRLLDAGRDDLFQDWSPSFRQAGLIEGLNCILQRIEDCCALSRGTFSDAGQTVRTATELKMARHRTYATVKGVQTALRNAISDMLDACALLLCLYGARKTRTAELDIRFDDSVLLDKSGELDDMLALLDHGVLTADEVRAWWKG